jgi:hypothetical protein
MYLGGYSQINLVPNPSFEYIDSCSFVTDNIMVAFPWDSLKAGRGGVSEVFKTNCPPFSINFGAGNQYPRTGNSLATLYVYNTIDVNTFFYQRDYLQTPLVQPLSNNRNYCVTFFLKLQNTSGIAIDRVGAYFDNGSITTQSYYAWAIANAQIESAANVYLHDTSNWMKVQGVFTANGNETYITLGNFRNNALTDTIMFPPPLIGIGNIVYYYVDDVSVLESNSKINGGNDTTILMGDTIELGKTNTEGLPCEWYDMAGNKIGRGSTALVHPTTNTKYVVRMDLCGFVSYDTINISVATGIPNSVAQNKISIYPNPASENINIVLDKDNSNLVYSIKLYNYAGIEVMNKVSKGSTMINVSNLLSGFYLITVDDGMNVERRKISVIH